MLLSPISPDSNTLPGQVPALPSSGAGAAGFAEQLQLVAAMAPPDAPVSLSIPGATNSQPLNSDDAAAGVAGLPGFASIPPAAPIAFHSTAELNLRGVVISPIALGGAPQAAHAPLTPTPAAPESSATPIAITTLPGAHSTAELNLRSVMFSPIAPDAAPQATVGSTVAPAPSSASETSATPIPVTNVPAAAVKAREEIAPALQDAAPAIEEVPILASGLPQKSSTLTAGVPAPEARVEHKHHAHAEKAAPAAADTPDSQPQTPAASQAAAPVAAPAAVPVHMVLPIAARFTHPLMPLGNRIPFAAPVATRTSARTENSAAGDPFDTDTEPKAAALPAEATKPLIATADQLAFAAKVQIAKPQSISHQTSDTPATARQAEPVQADPVHSGQQSQQHDSHSDADPQASMKAGESAVKSTARPAHAAPVFEAVATGGEEVSRPAKPVLSATARPASAAAAASDITPTRPEMPAAPMKDISVRIQSEQGENVEVRILHRAGDVQIAVKSADGDTAQGLRHGLSELSDRLNATGYHADTWHPGQAAAETTADFGGSQNSQQHSQQQQSQGDSQSHSGWSQQQGGRRDDNQSNRPRWVEELESNISSSPETGLFHGLIR
ncbi:MAG TPA: hypothetical protein VN519_12450 [Bryobacteraceae bacterium]|nr:hypothetical protein [Bryobacteraceae bacterium]